jgi:hypothetical protein
MKKLKPIHKFNNSRGATLCNICRTIISTGPATKELYCEKCKPKQETLEEVAERILLIEDLDLSDYDKRHILNAMVNIAKWKQEQDKNKYSEEDMDNYAEYCTTHVLKSKIGHPYLSVKEWFEQF